MKHRLLIFILAALSMLGALSIDAYLPALPAIAAHFSVSLPAAQQTLSIYLFAFAFMTLFYGTLSDSFGRRPVLLVSMVLYLIGSIGAGLSPSLGWLLFFRLLQGLSAGSGAVIGRAIVGDMLSGAEAQRMMSYISMVFGLAPAIAPVVGGWLMVASGWRSIFGFIALFSLFLLILCWFELPESLSKEHRHPFHAKVIIGNYWRVARHPQYLFRCLGMALSFSGILLYVGAAPSYVLDVLHLKVTDFAWLFIPLIGGMTLGSWQAARLSHRLSSNTIILLGYTIMGVSAVVNVAYHWLFVPRIPWAVIPIGTYSFGAQLCSPAMAITTLEIFPRVRGLAASLQTFMFMILFAIGSGFICPLLFGSGLKIGLAVVAGYLLSILFWFLGRLETEKSHESVERDEREIISTT